MGYVLHAVFPTTRWTLIVEAKSSPQARRAALTELMRVYWRPLFVWFRAHGLNDDAAKDATQQLLLQLMERDVVSKATPERGRLRAYLKTAAANWLVNRHDADVAQKRGAGAITVPIDAWLSERLPDPASANPDAAFEREWAATLVQRALLALKEEFDRGERVGPYALVETFFSPTDSPPSYRDAAAAHGMSVPQLKSFLHRARLRFRELCLQQVRDTVETDEQAEAELADVTASL